MFLALKLPSSFFLFFLYSIKSATLRFCQVATETWERHVCFTSIMWGHSQGGWHTAASCSLPARLLHREPSSNSRFILIFSPPVTWSVQVKVAPTCQMRLHDNTEQAAVWSFKKLTERLKITRRILFRWEVFKNWRLMQRLPSSIYESSPCITTDRCTVAQLLHIHPVSKENKRSPGDFAHCVLFWITQQNVSLNFIPCWYLTFNVKEMKRRLARSAEQTWMLCTAEHRESKVHHRWRAAWRSVLRVFAQQYPVEEKPPVSVMFSLLS